MSRRVGVAATVAVLVAGTLASGTGSAAASGDRARQDGFAAVRRATAAFHDLDRATSAGFGRLTDAAGIACIDNPAGGMGVHYVNGARIDGVLDPSHPEVLVYEPQADGSMRLGAVEYVVFAADWQGADPPMLYGQPLEYMPGPGEAHPNRYGLPAFWELHAWVWNSNPHGMFADWNPKVTCPEA